MQGVITSPVIYYYYMSNCSSTGDILREIDSRNLIESSCFLLVNCGAITNLDITELWKEQKARYKQSPFNIMTSVFTHMPYYKGVHRKRDIALALTESNQILAYKNMNESDCFSVLTESVLENNMVLFISFWFLIPYRHPFVTMSLLLASTCAVATCSCSSATTTTTKTSRRTI